MYKNCHDTSPKLLFKNFLKAFKVQCKPLPLFHYPSTLHWMFLIFFLTYQSFQKCT